MASFLEIVVNLIIAVGGVGIAAFYMIDDSAESMISAFVTAVRDSTLSYLGAMILVGLGFAVVGLGIVVVMTISPLGLILFIPVVFGIVLLIQFIDVAIVDDRLGVEGAISRSYRVVKSNLVAVVGYTILRSLVGCISVIPKGVAFLIYDSSSTTYQLLTAFGLLLSGLLMAYLIPVHIRFYRSITDDRLTTDV